MGMFDYVRCDVPLPDDRAAAEPAFQTKQLYCTMAHFTITANGRLIFRKQTHEALPNLEIRPGVFIPQYKLVHEEPIDMEYHGDIMLCGQATNEQCADYVARFTNGTLERIRPYEELSETHKSWLNARD